MNSQENFSDYTPGELAHYFLKGYTEKRETDDKKTLEGKRKDVERYLRQTSLEFKDDFDKSLEFISQNGLEEVLEGETEELFT